MNVITEEQVTKAILAHLVNEKWDILAYDFPQSGVGKMLRRNDAVSEKSKRGIIPDIITGKDGICLFFENKSRVDMSDFLKINALVTDNQYTRDISSLLAGYSIQKIFYGVAFPLAKCNRNALDNARLVDFIIGVSDAETIEFISNPYGIIL